eukprot:3568357-Rhodomonas_salina.2
MADAEWGSAALQNTSEHLFLIFAMYTGAPSLVAAPALGNALLTQPARARHHRLRHPPLRNPGPPCPDLCCRRPFWIADGARARLQAAIAQHNWKTNLVLRCPDRTRQRTAVHRRRARGVDGEKGGVRVR